MATFSRTSFYPGNVLEWEAFKNSSVTWRDEAINLIESVGLVELLPGKTPLLTEDIVIKKWKLKVEMSNII